ncbi:DP-EP family protein [Gallaecimonas xiamenensis]|uniref:Uncharacterized protein n=1 Tax=Gallaecimonas xiamenensis 3-C-1 TaxID=745411 RepID=K2K8Z1_9GAMM|nr:DP-EP family protein [Gallaecimonas xiamenensis]EKE73745.1 hypothetical protein B3C1_10117 [Gallaecimonas xiamenensis 3-C-1]
MTNSWPTKHINVHITGNEVTGFKFLYEDNKESCEQVTVDGPCYLEYCIKENGTQRDYGFKFDGVAFSNPFNNVITEAKISPDGQKIKLTNPYDVNSSTSEDYSVGFQFGFSFTNAPSGCKAKNLLLLSADPQVINQGDPTMPTPA